MITYQVYNLNEFEQYECERCTNINMSLYETAATTIGLSCQRVEDNQ